MRDPRASRQSCFVEAAEIAAAFHYLRPIDLFVVTVTIGIMQRVREASKRHLRVAGAGKEIRITSGRDRERKRELYVVLLSPGSFERAHRSHVFPIIAKGGRS